MVRRQIVLACVIAFAVVAAYSQSGGPANDPAFEVASIKPSGPGSVPSIAPFGLNLPTNLCRMTGGPGTSSPGQFTCLNCTLKPLVQRAYNLRTYELVGPDSMIDSDKWISWQRFPRMLRKRNSS